MAAITNQTYTFTPEERSVFNKENIDPKIKITTTNINHSKKGGKRK